MAKTAEEFIENLKLSELVDEQFDSRIKQLNLEADRLGQKRQADADKFVAELAAEVEAEEKKALAKMESKVNVLIGKVSDREKDVETAVQDALDAQRAADDYQKSAQLFNVASLFAAIALSATLFYVSSQ